MQTHTDTRSPLTRESTARIIRSDAPAKPNARLPQTTMPRAADRPAKYRHERKYEISLFDFFSLTHTLRTIMQPDPHADQDGKYLITSLYFDNCFDKALREKRDGLNQREKFRLRYYGSAPEKVFLEKKQKHAGLCLKNAAPLTLAECKLLLAGQRDWGCSHKASGRCWRNWRSKRRHSCCVRVPSCVTAACRLSTHPETSASPLTAISAPVCPQTRFSMTRHLRCATARSSAASFSNSNMMSFCPMSFVRHCSRIAALCRLFPNTRGAVASADAQRFLSAP